MGGTRFVQSMAFSWMAGCGPAALKERAHMIDHRAITRLPCQRAVRFTWDQKRKGQGFLTDIGLGGARLVSPVKLEPGVMVSVSPQQKSAGSEPVVFEVRWCNPSGPDFEDPKEAFQVGLALRAQMPEFVASWLADLLADQGLRPEQIAQRRQYLRVTTEIGAKLGGVDEELDPCIIQDLSVGGVAVRTKLLFSPGAAVQLGLPAQAGTPALILPGQVVSRRRGRGTWIYGISFTDPTKSQRTTLEQLVERALRGG